MGEPFKPHGARRGRGKTKRKRDDEVKVRDLDLAKEVLADDDLPDGAAMAMAAELGGFEDEADLVAELAEELEEDDDAEA